MDNKLALVYEPHGGGVRPIDVRPSEVGIVGVVLCVWAFAVYIFINQWGESKYEFFIYLVLCIIHCLFTIFLVYRHR